jgi:hypothetical protein
LLEFESGGLLSVLFETRGAVDSRWSLAMKVKNPHPVPPKPRDKGGAPGA